MSKPIASPRLAWRHRFALRSRRASRLAGVNSDAIANLPQRAEIKSSGVTQAYHNVSSDDTAAENGWLARVCTSPLPECLMALVIALIMPWAVYRAVGDFACDVANFVAGGAYVLAHGCRHPSTALDRYLPSVDAACTLLTLLPLSGVAVIYYLLNAGTWGGLLFTVQRGLLRGFAAQERSRATMAAALLVFPIVVDGLLVGAFHVLMLWLMIAGLLRVRDNRTFSGGTLLGIAIWLKLLPIIGAAYLLWKRKWGAAALAVGVAIVLDVGLSLAAFGWQGTIEEHRKWAIVGAAGSFDRLMHDMSENEDRITNESLTVVLRRFLTERAGFTRLSCADLSPRALSIVTGGTFAALACGVFVALRRRAPTAVPDSSAVEIATVALATVWFSPVVWSYHLTAAVPAMAVVMARPDSERRKQLVAAAWVIAMALFAVPIARAGGHMLWASFVVGAVLLIRDRAGESG